MSDYKKMWEELERNISFDLSMLADSKTVIEYADILRMASAKLIQQSMNRIKESQK